MKKIIYPIVFSVISTLSLAAPVDDLMVAVKRDSDISARDLIRAGVDVNALDKNGRTALTVAIQEQSAKVLPVLLNARGINLSTPNKYGESPLMMAIISNQTALAKQLIARGAATNKGGWSPLHYAATRGNVEVMRLLLARDAYIDAKAPNLATPLMMAAQFGDEAAVRFLLSRQADPWDRDTRGHTALDYARRGGKEDSIAMLASAQRKRKDPGKVRPLAPLSPASAAELRGEPIPEDPEPIPMIYPPGQEPVTANPLP